MYKRQVAYGAVFSVAALVVYAPLHIKLNSLLDQLVETTATNEYSDKVTPPKVAYIAALRAQYIDRHKSNGVYIALASPLLGSLISSVGLG